MNSCERFSDITVLKLNDILTLLSFQFTKIELCEPSGAVNFSYSNNLMHLSWVTFDLWTARWILCLVSLDQGSVLSDYVRDPSVHWSAFCPTCVQAERASARRRMLYQKVCILPERIIVVQMRWMAWHFLILFWFCQVLFSIVL